jgi:HAD superfamily phosphatase (TIGR01668 family)
MLAYLTPHLYLRSVLELEVADLRSRRLEGLLLDLDCTLKDYHATVVGPSVRAWLQTLRRAGIRLFLVSNGRGERVLPLAQELGVPFVARAFKPLPFGCRRAVRQLGLQPNRTAIVGDQLFADVLAGRLAGLFTILVRPTSEEEPWFTRVKRPLERRILRWLKSRASAPAFDERIPARDGIVCPARKIYVQPPKWSLSEMTSKFG